MKRIQWFETVAVILLFLCFFIHPLYAQYRAHCPDCKKGFLIVSPADGRVTCENCRHQFSAADILNAITLGSTVIDLTSLASNPPTQQYLRQTPSSLTVSKELHYGRSLAHDILSGHYSQMSRLQLAAVEEFSQIIIETEAMGSVISTLYGHIDRSLDYINTLCMATQLTVIHYLNLVGTNPVDANMQFDRTVRLWLLLKFWLNKLTKGSLEEREIQDILSMAIEGLSLSSVPDVDDMLAEYNAPQEIQPMNPDDISSSIRTLIKRIKIQTPKTYVTYQLPFFGRLAVFVSAGGTVYIATTRNTLIEITDTNQNLGSILNALIAETQQHAHCQDQQQALDDTVYEEVPESVANEPSLETLSSEERVHSRNMLVTGFFAGYLTGIYLTSKTSLQPLQRILFCALLGFTGATIGMATSPRGRRFVHIDVTEIWDDWIRWHYRSPDQQ